jgi:hypothetical protein
LIELLKSFSFVLCAAPAEYTRDQPARDLRDIKAVSE